MHRRIHMRCWPLGFLIVLSCTTTTRVVRLSPAKYEPRPTDSPVQLYSAKLPNCPFEEIGLVNARKEYGVVSTNTGVDALRKKVRELGGDALVGVGFVHGGDLAGTVIRFKRDDCTQ